MAVVNLALVDLWKLIRALRDLKIRQILSAATLAFGTHHRYLGKLRL